MSRTRVRRRRWALAMIFLGLAAATAGPATRAIGLPDEQPSGPSSRLLVVRQGGTVWEIAERAVGPEGDPRPMVDAIIQANDLSGARVLVGQRILVPSV